MVTAKSGGDGEVAAVRAGSRHGREDTQLFRSGWSWPGTQNGAAV
jgi:hypothetical protein